MWLCWLIIIGKIIKSLLDAINENIHKETNVNQWKNTAQVINWFKNIKSKKVSSFVNFDVGNFFPFISIDLLTDAIIYAKIITIIDDNELLKTTGEKTLTFRWIATMAWRYVSWSDIYFEQIKKCYKQRERWFISWRWIGNISKFTQNQNRKKEKANC